jgi:aromatic ring-opening dioxygenase catalytic subunit (LigB family)
MTKENKLPAIYLPHGGGPWNVMEDAFGDRSGYDRLRAWLVALGKEYAPKIKALLVVSAHWEERTPTLHFGSAPGMLYDYGGFPDFTYSLKWPAPGNPELAARAEGLLKAAGFEVKREEDRGYDHGTFVPLMVAFPEAKIPVAQLSLMSSLDPAAHFAVGRALEPLREEGVLIVGSGMSYHNMRGFFEGGRATVEASRRFDDWLAETVAIADPEKRRDALVAWRKAPGGLESHPRSEHLVPLFVVAGAAGADGGRRDYGGDLMGVKVSSHVFGA